MTREDAAYQLTRRRGKRGTVRRLTSTGPGDPETGDKGQVFTDTAVRWLFNGPTQYSRLIRAQAADQRVGDTEFVMWLPDVKKDFTVLKTEDKILYEGGTFEVVRSATEDNALVVMCREYTG